MHKEDGQGFQPTPIQEIIPLTTEERAKFGTVIYRHESTIDSDRLLVMATAAAMQAEGFQLAMDVDTDGSTANHAVVVRSATTERKAHIAEGALFLGVAEATRRRMAETNQSASVVATEILRTVTGKPELVEAFSKYYGGLRWSSDQERFVRTLFFYGTDFDPEFIENNVKGDDVSSLAYELNASIPYEQRRDWGTTPVIEILNTYPELDYRRLSDDSFRQSEEGQKLLRAWECLQGDILARRQKNSDLVITADGKVLAEPAIPLTKHPVIEALIIDEIALDRPEPKYSFGPNELAGIILASDSAPAHQALVDSITTRLPEGQRHAFGSPDEFQFKRGRVADVIQEYQRANNVARKALLKYDFLQILDSYSGTGSMATSVRQGYDSQIAQGVKDSWARSEAHKLNEIILDMLTVGFASPDKEIIDQIEEIVYGHLPDEEGLLVVEDDPLHLTREEIGLALLDAIDFIKEGSDPHGV